MSTVNQTNGGRFETRIDPVADERVLLATTKSGLRLRIAPTDRFGDLSAVIAFRYGSIDLGFTDGGRRRQSPEGVAHYLEHKLFEDQELAVFERFGRRGAHVNAMTGFGRTAYYFQATDQLEANLKDLLHLVSHAHLTPENVDKERGIIAQELRMYEDSPDFCGFFDLLRCLYREHPVRNPVGGTVASIQNIDVDELTACYRAFYRAGNAALAVAGPVDPDQVLQLADAAGLPAGEAPPSHCPDDLGPVHEKSHERRMAVARPRVLLGCKEKTLERDAEKRVRRDLVTRVLLDRLFGGASEIREDLHRRGIADDTLSASYTIDRSFGFAVVACETETPERTLDALREVLLRPVALTAADLERVRRKMLGRYVRAFESVHGVAMGHCDEALERLAPFGAIARMQSLTVDEVVARQADLFVPDAMAHALVHT